ncbi:MAG: hypothetical protein GY953_41655, partial [bacterium]|nr:hypothetical protein [bacterium]
LPITNPQQVVAIPTQVAPTPRMGRLVVFEGGAANRRIVGPRRVTTLTFAPTGGIATAFTDRMLAELERFGPFFSLELATQEPAADALAKTRAEVVLKDLQERGLAGADVTAVSRPLTAADRTLLPRTISSVNDIIFVQRG